MATTLGFKNVIDIPQWRPLSPLLGATYYGTSLAWDHRNDDSRVPLIYYLRAQNSLDVYNPITDDWVPLISPGLVSTVSSGSTCMMHPSQGPRGTIAAGATTTSIPLSTALAAAVGLNQLANKGDSKGFKIRIIGNAAGSSGKIDERFIIANTAGTTPTLMLDTPLSFTPIAGDGYEILSGRVFLLSYSTAIAGSWKYYDIATNSMSGNLAFANLPANVGTDSNGLALSECHVPWDRVPGSGFVSGGASYSGGVINAIQATATSSTTITGSGMPVDLIANEYRNFQIRIVEDTVTPTSVGQRRVIASHTAGVTGTFTIASWTVTPSASAKFVIENNDDLILLRSSATAAVYSYSVSTNAWSTATFSAAASAHGSGVIFEQAFGISRDPSHNRLHGHIFCLRGGNSASIDVLDITASTTGAWTNDIAYAHKSQTFGQGTSGAYDPATLGGRYLHINVNGTHRFVRFDMLTMAMMPGTYLRFPQGSSIPGQKLAMSLFIDGNTKLGFLTHATHSQTQMFSMAIQS